MPDSTIEVRLTTDDSPTQPSPASEPGWKSRRNRRSDYVAQAWYAYPRQGLLCVTDAFVV